MKAIIVDDEPIMLRSFKRNSAGIEGLELVEAFSYAEDAVDYAKENRVDLAFLDIEMPGMNGIECAKALRAIDPDILIVFISAYEKYLRDSNELGADYYVIKPYKKETIERVMVRLRPFEKKKEVYIRTFGRFTVLKNGNAVALSGKAKEILALVVTKRGKEISNEEIYSTLWEDREYSNVHMKVYYNALKRLKDALKAADLSDLLLPTAHGQMVNTELFDCDYYEYLDKGDASSFEGEFLSEYSWGEYILGEMMNRFYE